MLLPRAAALQSRGRRRGGMTERRYKRLLGSADVDETLAEIDLQLSLRRRFEPRRCQSQGIVQDDS